MFDGSLGRLGQHPTESHGCIHENENMCRGIARRDRYPPRVKAPMFLVIHMCPTVRAQESVGRRVKPAMRPRKFATHKKTHGFEYK